MTAQYIYLVIFFCIGYLIVTDESIAKAFVFVTQIAKNKFLVFKWWFIHNPKTPWARYSMHRRSMKLAEELMKEFENKNL
jgi:Fe-S oxidoreductase